MQTTRIYFLSGTIPSLAPFNYTAVPSTPLQSYILAYSQDMYDPMQVYIAALPPKGTLQQSDGTPITSVPTLLTSSNFGFIYTPVAGESGVPYTNFSFYAVSMKPNIANSTIKTSYINVPASGTPNAAPVIGDYTLYSCFSTSFCDQVLNFNVTDPDTPTANLNVVFATLVRYNDVQVYDCCGNAVNLLQPYGVTSGIHGTIAFIFNTIAFQMGYFYIFDDKGAVSPMSRFYFTAGRGGNSVPSTIANGPSYIAQRGIPLAISLGILDADWDQIFTVTVIASMQGAGILKDRNNLTLSTTTFTLQQPQDGVCRILPVVCLLILFI